MDNCATDRCPILHYSAGVSARGSQNPKKDAPCGARRISDPQPAGRVLLPSRRRRWRQRVDARLERLIVARIGPERTDDRGVVRRNQRLARRDAILLEWMRGEPALHGGWIGGPLVDEDLEHLRYSVRTDAGANGVADTLHVRFRLVLPAETCDLRR